MIGKGRKERVGLLGRPAREALGAYLDVGRPVLLARALGRTGDGGTAAPADPPARSS